MDRTVVSVSVSYSQDESKERVRGMLEEIPQLCLSFANSVELATFLQVMSAARYAFERLVSFEGLRGK